MRIPLLLLWAGCGPGSDDGPHQLGVDQPPPQPTVAPVPAPNPTTPTAPVEITSVAVHPPESTAVFLVQQLDVDSSRPTTLSAVLTDPEGTSRTITWTELTGSHRVALVGLRAQTAYTVAVSVEDEGGSRATAQPIAFTNGDPPALLPDVRLIARDPAALEPGWILAPPWSPELGRVIALYDSEGQLVWAYVPKRDWKSVVPTGRGTLMALEYDVVREIDWLGNDVRNFSPTAAPPDILLPFDWLHHDVVPLEDGGFYVLTLEPYTAIAYPLDYTFTAFADSTIGDQLVNRVAADGTLLERFSLADLLAPSRIGFESLDVVWSGEFDWGHANGIAIGTADDSLVVSLRHQDAVVKIDRQTGALKWIFGNHDGWPPELEPYLFSPVGDFQWPGHQHAPELHPGGKLMLFDNGNDGRTNPYSIANGGGEYSRVVEFTLDETAMTASLDWEWSATTSGKLMSYALGNADLLPVTGNVLATFGWLYAEGGVDNTDAGRGDVSTRIIEFSPTTGATVLDLGLSGDVAVAPAGWYVDRALLVADPYGATATIE